MWWEERECTYVLRVLRAEEVPGGTAGSAVRRGASPEHKVHGVRDVLHSIC